MSTKKKKVEVKTEEVKEVPAPAPAPAKSEGSEIASAIAEGLKAVKEEKKFVITGDKNVIPRFAVVKNKETGEVMIRETETGTLSKVQLKSIEEKQASLQDVEVEEL